MKDYIINNKTIALLKKNNKTIIFNVENEVVINKNIKSIIENNCLLYGSNMKGRLVYAKNILKKTYKLPIFINKNIILLPLNSLRNEESLIIILNKIIDYKYKNNILYIKCLNNKIFSCNLSKNSFENLIINGVKLNNNLNIKNI